MKRRKSVVVVFLIAAAMMLSVGYAALTDVLDIKGDIGANTTVAQPEFDADIYFSATSVTSDDTGNQAASQILEGRDDATITAKHFTTEGQKVIVKYTIINESSTFAARITPEVTTITFEKTEGGELDHPAIFEAKWSWNDTTTDVSVFELQPGATKDLWVTITLKETPTEEHMVKFTVTYNVEAVEPTTTPMEP